jgi:hypothetical protein
VNGGASSIVHEPDADLAFLHRHLGRQRPHGLLDECGQIEGPPLELHAAGEKQPEIGHFVCDVPQLSGAPPNLAQRFLLGLGGRAQLFRHDHLHVSENHGQRGSDFVRPVREDRVFPDGVRRVSHPRILTGTNRPADGLP